MQLLQVLPEAELEARLDLGLSPELGEAVDVAARVSQEEFGHVGLVVFVSQVVVGREVDGATELHAVVLSVLANLDETLAVLLDEHLKLGVQLLDGVFIFGARVADELVVTIIVQVEVEVGTEQFSLIQDLVGHHQPLQLVLHGLHYIEEGYLDVLMPLGHLGGIPQDVGIHLVIKSYRPLMIAFDALLEIRFAVDTPVKLAQNVGGFHDLLFRVSALHEIWPLLQGLFDILVGVLAHAFAVLCEIYCYTLETGELYTIFCVGTSRTYLVA